MGAGILPAAISGLCTSLGALPFLFLRDLPRRTYDGILGLGAGLMLAAATLGLCAEALAGVNEGGSFHLARFALVISGFAVGAGIAALMDRFIPHQGVRLQPLLQSRKVGNRLDRRAGLTLGLPSAVKLTQGV